MRYFLNIRDGEELLVDPDGSELETVELAIEEAKASARDLMAEKLRAGEPVNGQSFEISDAHGTVVATVKFRDVLPL
ncbi:DUF6894 family protein [Rhizobium sp. NPDC090275]|uniref:DUF6894 family protein n=1 Tax=Rhizobium sp. NPDC090275 TaxID=3364498 RepID=UPI000DDDFC77